MPSIASVYVDILPSTAKIADGIRTALREADGDVGEAAKRWRRQIGTELGRGVTVDVDADTSRARQEIDRTRRQAGEPVRTQLDIDLDNAKRELTALRVQQEARKLGITVEVDTAAAATQLQLLRTQAQIRGIGVSSMGLGGIQTVASIGAIGVALVDLAAVAAAASQAILLIPAALTAVGVGAGTLLGGLSGIKDAYSAVEKASKSAGEDQASKAKAVASATNTLNSAIQDERRAQQDVARARKDALQQLRDLNSELRSGSLDETQAVLDLQAARERLATDTFETATQYQQAQLDVLQAEQRVNEAHARNIELQEDANDKQAKGVEGADAVVAAKEREAAAHQNVVDAQQSVSEANEKTSTSATAAAAAMAGLSPAGQEFVNSLVGLTPTWDAFLNSLQEPLLTGLGPQLTSTVNALLPAIQPGLQSVAGAFNQMFSGLLTMLSDPEMLGKITEIVNNIAAAFVNLAPSMGSFIQAFVTLTESGSGKLPEIAASISNMADRFANFIAAAEKSGDLDKWLQGGIEAVGQLVTLAKLLVDAFMQLVPVGEQLLPKIITLFEDIKTLMPVVIAAVQGINTTAVQPLLDAIHALAEGWKTFEEITSNFSWDNFKNGAIEAINIVIDKVNDLIDGINLLNPFTDIPQIPRAGGGRYGGGGGSFGPAPPAGPAPAPPAGPAPAPPAGPAPAAAPGTPVAPSGFDWDAVAKHESGGNWSNHDTGHNGHYGGLQFSPETWKAYGGAAFAPNADGATREQQMMIADRVAFYGHNGLAPQGLGAWEVITKGQVPGVTTASRPPTAATPTPVTTAGGVPTPVTTSAMPTVKPTPGEQVGTTAVRERINAALGMNVASGWRPPDVYDEHSGGNAIDVPVSSVTEGDKVMAEAFKDPNVDYVIWNHRVYQRDGSSKAYTGPNPHTDHVHVHVVSTGYAPGNEPSATGKARGANAAAFPSTPTTPTPTTTDSHVIPLSTNIPPGQRTKAKESGSSMAETFGRDFVAGIAEALGFDGSVFKSPTDFGIMQLLGSASKIGAGWASALTGTETTSGDTSALFPGGGGGGGGAGGLLNMLTSFIPGMGPMTQPQTNPLVIDQSVNMAGANFGHDPKAVGDQIDNIHMRQARPGLRPLPGP